MLNNEFDRLSISRSSHRPKRPQKSYTAYKSQLTGHVKFFATFKESDMSFCLEVKGVLANVEYGEKIIPPEEMADIEEDNQSEDEVIQEGIENLQNDLNRVLWDELYGS